MVAVVTMLFLFVFFSLLLFHFVQQNRHNTSTQLASIARSVRQPLSEAMLKADIPEAKAVLGHIQLAGIVSQAEVMLPTRHQALHIRFVPERLVPVTVARLFRLPVQISLPLYSLENPQPLAYLVLQADPYRLYQFAISTLKALVIVYLLLVLILTLALTWGIHWLIVRPLYAVADSREQAMRFPVSSRPNKVFLLRLLEQNVAHKTPVVLFAIACNTLQDAAGVLQEEQREILLLALVDKIKQTLSPQMVLAQVSAYDFALLVYEAQEPWHAIMLSQKILAAINEPLPIQGIQLRPGASIGIAMYEPDVTAEQIYRRAISTAFAARHKGKNQIEFFDPEQMAQAQKRLTEESDILAALDNHQFALWLQPQIDTVTGKLCSAEALLRQRQPDGCWSLPNDLIDSIESCGLMVTVGYWVLEEACRQLATWQSRGVMLPLSVNISALQLLHHDMVPGMLALLNRYHIVPGTLILEVTESRRIDDPKAAVEILRPLRDAGISIALDDFGMGYAGLYQLQYMKSVPVDILKIDKVFIDPLPEDVSMVAAIIQLGRSLNLRMVAEGIETEEQYAWLRTSGVDILQGYLFARAVPPAIFEQKYLGKEDSLLPGKMDNDRYTAKPHRPAQ